MCCSVFCCMRPSTPERDFYDSMKRDELLTVYDASLNNVFRQKPLSVRPSPNPSPTDTDYFADDEGEPRKITDKPPRSAINLQHKRVNTIFLLKKGQLELSTRTITNPITGSVKKVTTL